jgi:phosphoribosyl 1,2-cyclic phosphodiesterase
MRSVALASGSSGNCYFIEGTSGALLIDAGRSAAEIRSYLAQAGLREEELRAILVTHEHGDHAAGVDVLARRLGIPVIGTGGTLAHVMRLRQSRRPAPAMTACAYRTPFRIGDFKIEAFPVSHDAAEPCGFRIREHDLSLVCCTDTGEMTGQAMDAIGRCDGLLLESNHCPVMLREGPYPEMLKRRIRSRHGHLSNPDAAACLQEFSSSLHAVLLVHLSEVNNTPALALASARQAAGLYLGGIEIRVAVNRGASAWPEEITLG